MLLVTFTKKSLSITDKLFVSINFVYFIRKNLLVKRTIFSLLRQLVQAAFRIISLSPLFKSEACGANRDRTDNLPDFHRDALS